MADPVNNPTLPDETEYVALISVAESMIGAFEMASIYWKSVRSLIEPDNPLYSHQMALSRFVQLKKAHDAVDQCARILNLALQSHLANLGGKIDLTDEQRSQPLAQLSFFISAICGRYTELELNPSSMPAISAVLLWYTAIHDGQGSTCRSFSGDHRETLADGPVKLARLHCSIIGSTVNRHTF